MNTYQSNLLGMAVEHADEYVVIQGETLLGFYPTYEAAVTAGDAGHGLDLFVVKRVRLHKEPVLLPGSAPVHGVNAFADHSS